MSPPQVNLAGKEHLKEVDLSDEPCVDKDKDFPSVITVETERRAQALRCHHRRQRYRRIICGVAIVILLSVAALSTMCLVRRLRHHHRKHWECHHQYGKEHHRVRENVKVDHEKRIIFTKHEAHPASQTSGLHVLHEYGRGLVAYKNLDKNICYIDRLDETFEEGYERWEKCEKHDRRDRQALKLLSEPIEVDVLEHICDKHIYMHCRNAQSYWAMEVEEKDVTTAMKVVYV